MNAPEPMPVASSPAPRKGVANDGTPHVALVHHWLVAMRGGEKVLEALSAMYPSADIFTLVCDRNAISEQLRRHTIHTSWIRRLPLARRHFRIYLPLFPRAARGLDLSGHDLVLSSDASLIKAVRAPKDVPHICYCHSPPRYLWDLFDVYRKLHARNPIQRWIMGPIARYLRYQDFKAARRVHVFVANSHAVAERIARNYRRNAEVIHPPVDVDYFARAARSPGDYYLWAGQLVGYKQPRLAVETFTQLNRKLIVVGEGPELSLLKPMAGPTIEFAGRVSDDALRDYYAGCRALIFPGEEDFGMVPVEAQATGAPVIALARGGALDSVQDGQTGLLFDEPTVEALLAAVRRFESIESQFDPDICRQHARQFDAATFTRKMTHLIDETLRAH